MKLIKSKILFGLLLLIVSSTINAQTLRISNLEVTSSKNYLIKYDGFDNDSLQYIDRDYRFDRVPEELKGGTLIMTAGNDKMFEESERCFSFNVNKRVLVSILYADKYSVKPDWLNNFTNTQKKVYRQDSSTETMKGIFSVYSKEFQSGLISINGCLGKGIKTDHFVRTCGSGYCMFSVLIREL